MRYKFSINTDDYVCGKCSKRNWEAGTRNDYMLTINGITRTLYNLREVKWQLELFRGNSFLSSEYDDNSGELSERYTKFLSKNKITYRDRLCGFDRSRYLSAYGIPSGYVDIDKILETVKKEGAARIYFNEWYDIRQCDKALDGCFIEIRKMK